MELQWTPITEISMNDLENIIQKDPKKHSLGTGECAWVLALPRQYKVSLVCLGCYNKTLQPEWLINKRNLFLTV